MMPVARKRVVFADTDHVVALLQDLIDPKFLDKHERLMDFVAPEALGALDWDEFTCGLISLPGLEVRHATRIAEVASLDPNVIVVRRAAVPGTIIEQCRELRLIQRLGQRTDGIDLDAAARGGVAVSCLTRASLISVAEHVLMLMLAMSRRLRESDNAVRHARHDARASVDADGSCWNWAGIAGISPLHGRTLGIVGMGEVGALVAERAKAFGMHVAYTDRRPLVGVEGFEHLSLIELLATSDFVSLHVPGPAGAHPLIDATSLQYFRPGACLINTSRGRLIDEPALIEALVSGQLAAAALDVHAIEPRPSDDALLGLDNVLLTPHLAAGSRRTVLSEARAVFANIRAVFDGQPPRHDEYPAPIRTTAASHG